MKGNRDPEFLDKINGVFICFVATAMRHCLKAWRTGECSPVPQEFKYESAWCKLQMTQKGKQSNAGRRNITNGKQAPTTEC